MEFFLFCLRMLMTLLKKCSGQCFTSCVITSVKFNWMHLRLSDLSVFATTNS